MKTRLAFALLLLALLLTACFGEPQQIVQEGAAASNGRPWPTRGWQRSEPDQQGLDAALFDQMRANIDERDPGLHALLVVRNGYLVYEDYGGGYDRNQVHNQYSVTKSVAATLVGIAIDQGLIPGVETPILNLFPGRAVTNVDRRKSAITLEHVLTMTSGLAWVEGDPAFNELYSSPDWTAFMLEKPMASEPGARFLYCSGCSHLLTSALQAAGQDVQEFADANLFTPLGISNYRWDTDSTGIPVGGWGLHLTPRDMAKLGYLYLNKGEWDGRQIVSDEWIQRAASRKVETGGDLGYGYQWWIYPDYGAYTALGRYGQTIFIIPSLDILVVATGQMSSSDPVFDLIDRFIVPSVIESGD